MKQLLFILIFFCSILSFSQNERLIALPVHPKVNAVSNQDFIQQKSKRRTAALTLPFFDDFYQTEIFPDVTRWEDNFVYINTTFPKETVTVGVATFDGTNSSGKPYSLILNASGYADKLTSNPIDLSGLTGSDDVYLSFYYLRGDFGETPTAPEDSLLVQFLDNTLNWKTVWFKLPDALLNMRQVFLKVDSTFLRNDFQFRFQTVGNLNGSNDTWHIDYVKLDKNRDTVAERNIKEMAYEFLPPSILKDYYVMPYHQFDTTDLADTLSVFVRNNFINPTTDIKDYYDATVVNTAAAIASFSGPSRDFSPLTENEIKYPKFDVPLDLTDDTIVIKVDYRYDVSAEAGEPAPVQANNFMKHEQVFSNYFAYDDGSPERGYWLADESNYRMAIKYGMRKEDTLQAIKLQLFPVRSDNVAAVFSICIWKNFTLRSVYNPSDLIYEQTDIKLQDLIAEFGVDTLNGYYYAPIKPQFVKNGAAFPLLLSDTFAIGLTVKNENSLTVGFDRNNNRSYFNYYVDANTEKWSRSTIPGTMIINPVVGKALPSYLTPVKEIKTTQQLIKIYPNPANTNLFVEGIKEHSNVEIFSINGNLVLQKQLTESDFIDIMELPAATYVIRVTNLKSNQSGSSKFIKSE